MSYAIQAPRGTELNRLYDHDTPVHEWYRFVLSYPPHLVRDYLTRFNVRPGQRVLDPFCGTGTTVVEARKAGVEAVGIEANPVVHFAACTKTDWTPDPDRLAAVASEIAAEVSDRLDRDGVPDSQPYGDATPVALRTLPPEQDALLIAGSLSPRPLHKALVLRDVIDERGPSSLRAHLRLAFAKHLVHSASNLRFGPEVGVGRARPDAAIVGPWLAGVRAMADDLRTVDRNAPLAHVLRGDARYAGAMLEPRSVDAVITSPPYPNEKDYSRTTRLESVMLGFMVDKTDLRAHKDGLLRSNTRGVYVADTDDRWVENDTAVQSLADRIDARRIELGKTSGFEKLYGRVVRLYFGGMARHLHELSFALRPGARLAYVVGDQASFFRILIRTGELLEGVAAAQGYEVLGRDLFRTRFSTATGDQLREEAVILRWNG